MRAPIEIRPMLPLHASEREPATRRSRVLSQVWAEARRATKPCRFWRGPPLHAQVKGRLAGSTRVDTAPVGSAVARTMDAPWNPREDDRRQKPCSEDTAEDSDRTANGGPTTVPGRPMRAAFVRLKVARFGTIV